MAWRNSGVLIRQLLGKRSNPCRCAGLIHHQHQNYSSLTSIQTLTLTSSPSLPHTSAIHVPSASKLLLSHDSHHFLQHRRHFTSESDSDLDFTIDPFWADYDITLKARYERLMKKIEDNYSASASASDTLFSTPSDMVIIWSSKELKRAIKQVKDGRFPAVFYFTNHWCMPPTTLVTPTIRKLREGFPHVIIFKIRITGHDMNMGGLLMRMRVDHSPEFHFYQNGNKVDGIKGCNLDRLIDTFGKLYRYVDPVKIAQPTSSSGMGKRRTQQLVVRVGKDGDGNGVKGRKKVASSGTFSQHRGGMVLSQQSGFLGEADESRSTATSLRQVMREVEYFPLGACNGKLWWFAKGLFKSQPEKRVMFSNLTEPSYKRDWLIQEVADE